MVNHLECLSQSSNKCVVSPNKSYDITSIIFVVAQTGLAIDNTVLLTNDLNGMY